MTQVHLADGTVYLIDTDNSYNARRVVEYKLKDRGCFRVISAVLTLAGTKLDPGLATYNSGNQYDGVELRAFKGHSYRWGDRTM